jgi:hypothetical protein
VLFELQRQFIDGTPEAKQLNADSNDGEGDGDDRNDDSEHE